MNQCVKCHKEITQGQEFCHHCGTNQTKEELLNRIDKAETNISNTIKNDNRTLLVLLCILTILGSAFGICRGFFYELVSAATSDHNNYIRGWVYFYTNLGTLVGAILMLKKSLKGLYIYSASQATYIITVLLAVNSYNSKWALAVALFFLVPSVVFLILYWLKDVKGKLA